MVINFEPVYVYPERDAPDAAATIAKNSAAFKLAPPTNAPSTFG
jgi:hypothetical protein